MTFLNICSWLDYQSQKPKNYSGSRKHLQNFTENQWCFNEKCCLCFEFCFFTFISLIRGVHKLCLWCRNKRRWLGRLFSTHLPTISFKNTFWIGYLMLFAVMFFNQDIKLFLIGCRTTKKRSQPPISKDILSELFFCTINYDTFSLLLLILIISRMTKDIDFEVKFNT